MGSMADLNYSKATEKLAEEVGFWIAKNGAALIFGAEKDGDSLSTAACRGAKKTKGITIGVTYAKGLDVFEKNNIDVVIATGLERGGGRELPLVLSCDAVITLNGGSGTLTEVAIAYQANIPIVVLKATGGWSGRLAGQYLDDRKRIKAEIANSPKEAVLKALDLIALKQAKQKDILVLTAVHGDESIGVRAMRIIDKRIPDNRFAWTIANEKALSKNQRFVDADLNRAAPGNKNSKQYEVRRASELLKLANNYRYVFDIHGTSANSGIFTIVTNPTLENLALASILPIDNIVIWISQPRKKSGPITQFVKCGLEIECGLKNSPKTLKQLAKILEEINGKSIDYSNLNLKGKNLFQVYGKLMKSEINNKNYKKLKDFKKTKINTEIFFPLLVGRYLGLACYKMRKLNHRDHPL